MKVENLPGIIWFITNGALILLLHYAIGQGGVLLFSVIGFIWLVSLASMPLLSDTVIISLMLKNGKDILTPPVAKWFMVLGDLVIAFLLISIGGQYALFWYITAFAYLMSMFIQHKAYNRADQIRAQVKEMTENEGM